jgi:hypothetical protein
MQGAAGEFRGGSRDEIRAGQPHCGRKFLGQRAREARPKVPLVDRKALQRFASAHQQRRHCGRIAANDGRANAGLDVSKQRQFGAPSGIAAPR